MNFGTPSDYLGYNALEDFFPQVPVKPNPECDENHCKKRQKEYQELMEKKQREQVKSEKLNF